MNSANKIFMQNLPITADQVAKLTGNVTDLAVAQGKDATQALAALNRGLASGRMNLVAYELGLEKAVQYELMQTNQLPQNVRVLEQFLIISKAVASQLRVTGQPVDTLTDSFSA